MWDWFFLKQSTARFLGGWGAMLLFLENLARGFMWREQHLVPEGWEWIWLLVSLPYLSCAIVLLTNYDKDATNKTKENNS